MHCEIRAELAGLAARQSAEMRRLGTIIDDLGDRLPPALLDAVHAAEDTCLRVIIEVARARGGVTK